MAVQHAAKRPAPQTSSRRKRGAAQPFDQIPPGHNALYRVAFEDGSKGFMAKCQDASALAFFDENGERIFGDPGWSMVVRMLGTYVPWDEDGFWALIACI